MEKSPGNRGSFVGNVEAFNAIRNGCGTNKGLF